jgi:uncharacterized membrane protein
MLDSREFWFDEVITFDATQMSWWALVEDRYWNGHSPLYFFMVKLFLQVTGVSPEPGAVEWLLRLPSAILMTAPGALLIHATWAIAGDRAACALAVLWLNWPPLVHYGHEARPYGLLIFFVALGIWGTLLLLRDLRVADESGLDSPSRGVLLWASGIGSVGAAMTMPLGAVAALVLEMGALLAFAGRVTPALWKRRCWVVWPLVLAVFLLLVPALMAKVGNYWTEDKERAKFSFANIWRLLLKGTYAADRRPLYALPPALLLIYALAARGRSREESDRGGEFKLLWTGAFLFPALLLLVSLNTSVLIQRYFLPTLCFLLPLYAVLMTRWQTRTAAILASAMIVMTLAAGVRTYTRDELRLYSEIKALLDEHDIWQATLYAQIPLDRKAAGFYLGDRVAEVVESKQGKSLGDIARHPYWIVRSKGKAAGDAGGIAAADQPLQCSFTLSDHIVTFVARDPRIWSGCGAVEGPACADPAADMCVMSRLRRAPSRARRTGTGTRRRSQRSPRQ